MKTVLVAYASRMGSTQEIAAAIGDQLTSRGFEVQVVAAAAAAQRPDLRCRRSRQCSVHGALGQGRGGLPETSMDLTSPTVRPGCSRADRPDLPQRVRPTPTPRAVQRLCDKIGLAAPTTFGGNLDHSRAKGLLARWVSHGDLAGDFRDWDQIRAWADDVADQLTALGAPAGT